MAFLHPRNLYAAPDAASSSFTPLFRLLDDFDNYSRQCSPQGGNTHGRRSGLTHFQPKFDLREVGEAYELHGELPGMNKENVQIEFTEPQSMVIRGKIERSYTAGTPATGGQIENVNGANNTITEGDESTRRNSHQATVEDEADSAAQDSGFEEVQKPGDDNSVAEKAVSKEPNAEPKQPADKAKYWLTERSIGEFSRTFNFPSRVDQDAVSASFKDGLLSVTVPKAKKHESRRIAVN